MQTPSHVNLEKIRTHSVSRFIVCKGPASLRCPKKAETFDWNSWRFEVVDMERKRVDEVFARPIGPVIPSD